MQRSVVFLLMLAAVMALGAGQAGAGPTTVVCGQVITQNTHVGNDLTNCPGDGLVIGADNIKLDLGGHLIDGDAINAQTDDGIDNRGGFDNVKIVHGTIEQFHQGVQLIGATQNKIEHLKVTANFDGIHLSGSDTNKISHNDVWGSGSSAIVLITGSDGNRVDHNRAHDNPAWGITQDFSNGNTYSHNKVYKNNIAGIEPFNSTNLRLDHNDAKQNTIGIELFNVDASVLTDNHVRSNIGDGIHSFVGSTGNTFRKNHADKNGDDGIDIADAGNTITKNHADKNVDLGIVAAPANVDGGHNKAHHNGNPAQCVGVTCH